jgi:hypothetical protein
MYRQRTKKARKTRTANPKKSMQRVDNEQKKPSKHGQQTEKKSLQNIDNKKDNRKTVIFFALRVYINWGERK